MPSYVFHEFGQFIMLSAVLLLVGLVLSLALYILFGGTRAGKWIALGIGLMVFAGASALMVLEYQSAKAFVKVSKRIEQLLAEAPESLQHIRLVVRVAQGESLCVRRIGKPGSAQVMSSSILANVRKVADGSTGYFLAERKGAGWEIRNKSMDTTLIPPDELDAVVRGCMEAKLEPVALGAKNRAEEGWAAVQ